MWKLFILLKKYKKSFLVVVVMTFCFKNEDTNDCVRLKFKQILIVNILNNSILCKKYTFGILQQALNIQCPDTGQQQRIVAFVREI
jgi:hypothetical protein